MEVHRSTGVVRLEKKGDVLYLDGQPINLYRSPNQQNGQVIGGHKLRTELEARGGNASAKVLDHLIDYPAMWPESWKKDENGNAIYVFFWGDIFRDPSGGNLYIRFGYWDDDEVVSGFDTAESGCLGR